MQRALIITILLSGMACDRLHAGPSLAGPTGVLTIPSALTLSKWEVDASYDLWNLDSPTGETSFSSLRGGVGVADQPDGGLEVGLTKPSSNMLNLSDAYIWGKYRIPGILTGGALAVGGVFSTDKRHYSSVFVVGSSAIHENFTLHYGGGVNVYGDPMGWAWYGGRRDNGRANAAFAVFGAQVDIKAFTINVDYNGSYISYGVTFFPDSFFSVQAFQLGRGDFERMSGLDHQYGFGVNLRF